MSILRSERGASAVEFALVLPLLLFITFGIIEMAIILYDKAVITNAAREGARRGTVYRLSDGSILPLGDYDPILEPDIQTAVMNYANNLLINLGGSADLQRNDIDVKHDPANPILPGESTITVTVKFTYSFLTLPNMSKFFGPAMDGDVDLIAETKMRME